MAMLLCVSGVSSGAGKSSVCIALLSALMSQCDYTANDLAYIKPATQCEGVQLVAKFCHKHHIVCVPIGPVVYRHGFTYSVIDGSGPSVQQLHNRIRESINSVQTGKKIVVVDGVGYPSVGSVSCTSNADIARLMKMPVLFVSPGGVGNAIDSVNLAHTFFQSYGVKVLGAVFNKVSTDVNARHSYENCVKFVSLYFKQKKNGNFCNLYGFLPLHSELIANSETSSVCVLNNSSVKLEMNSTDTLKLDVIERELVPKLNIESLLADLKSYFHL